MQQPVMYSIRPLGEQAVVVQFDSDIRYEILTQVLTFQERLNANKFPGLIEVVPSYCSVAVYYDVAHVHRSSLEGNTAFEKVKCYLESLSSKEFSLELEVKNHAIPICYDLKCGIDLPELSKTLELSVDDIIELHTRQVYTVYLIGFTPGFPYMGTLPKELESKRRESPRKKVPHGSVAIAGKQTGIYPFDTPGGWQIIGRTPLKLFSIENEHPSLLKPGDRVKFESITFKEFEKLEQA